MEVCTAYSRRLRIVTVSVRWRNRGGGEIRKYEDEGCGGGAPNPMSTASEAPSSETDRSADRFRAVTQEVVWSEMERGRV